MSLAGSASGDLITALWAAQSGIFQKYALDVDVQRMSSGSAIISAVLGNSLDLGKGSIFNLIVAHSKGVPLLLVYPSATYSTANPDAGMLVAQDSPYHGARDLNGKTIAVSALGDFYVVMNSAWIDQNGGDAHSIKFLELPQVATVDAIVSGRVDAGTIAEPFLSQAVRSGKCRIIGYPENLAGSVSIATGYFCTAGYAAQNAAVLSRFRKAMDESVAYVNSHHAQMIPLIAKFTGLQPENVVLQSDLGSSATLRDTRLIQPTIDLAAKYKAIPKGFAARDVIDPTLFST